MVTNAQENSEQFTENLKAFSGEIKDIENQVSFEVKGKEKSEGKQAFRKKTSLLQKQEVKEKPPSPNRSTKESSGNDSDDPYYKPKKKADISDPVDGSQKDQGVDSQRGRHWSKNKLKSKKGKFVPLPNEPQLGNKYPKQESAAEKHNRNLDIEMKKRNYAKRNREEWEKKPKDRSSLYNREYKKYLLFYLYIIQTQVDRSGHDFNLRVFLNESHPEYSQAQVVVQKGKQNNKKAPPPKSFNPQKTWGKSQKKQNNHVNMVYVRKENQSHNRFDGL